MRHLLILVGFAVSLTAHLFGQNGELTERSRLLKALSLHLLGAEEPILKSEGGYSWVALAPIGTVLPGFAGLEASEQTGPGRTMIEASETRLYDSPLDVVNGIASSRLHPIAQVYREILNEAFPFEAAAEAASAPPREASAWGRVLYRQPDRADKVRGIVYSAEPSESYRRYQEYRRLASIVEAGQGFDRAWKAEPRLVDCKSREEAKKLVDVEWKLYGFKNQIETALTAWSAEDEKNPLTKWRKLSGETFSPRGLGVGLFKVKSALFPPPSEWYGMQSWSRFFFYDADRKTKLSCKIAIVEIHREWLDVPALCSGSLKRRNGIGQAGSDVPTFERFPDYELSVLPMSLILIRDVVIEGAQPEKFQSIPCAFPEFNHAVNLAGYIVRVLPKPGSALNTASILKPEHPKLR